MIPRLTLARALLAAVVATASTNAEAQSKAPAPAAPARPNAPDAVTLEDAPTPPTNPLPPVSDPMLAPPAGSATTIRTWAEAIELLRTRSPDYAAQFQTIRQAEAQTRTALASLLPLLNGTGTYTHNFKNLEIPLGGRTLVTPPPNVGVVGASAQWTPLNAKAIYDYKTAQRAVDVAKLNFEDRRRLLATGLVSSMLATLSSARVAELNRNGLRTALERLQLTETRLQFGQGTPLDVDRARKDTAAARRLVINGDESLRRAREALGVALGSADPIAVSTDLDLESFERAVASTCKLNDSLEHRPDIVAARERLAVAKRNVTSWELAPLPTVGVQSTAAYSTNPVLGPAETFSVAAVLTVPFYDGGYRYGQLRNARAVEEQARADLEAKRLAAVVSSARAKRNVEVSRADRDVTKGERDLAATIDGRVRESYARGRGTSLDLVLSAEALRSAEINLALLEFSLAEARADAVLENAECGF